MKLSLIVVLFLFITNHLFASVVVGKISSSINGAPIIGANIYLENTSFGAASNNKGEFEIKDVPAGEYAIIATYIGYKLRNSPTISLKPDEQLRCDLEMEEEIYQADNIVVTGTRSRRLIKDSPVSTEVIHADEIMNLGTKNVGEVLEERAGIIITQDGARGGILSAQLQGLNDEHTLILVDGVPVIGRIAGKLDLSRLSVQNIERIEIVKGAASSLYGSEAVGRTLTTEITLSTIKSVYFNLKDAKIVEVTDETTSMDWDIKTTYLTVNLNGGTSGPGDCSAIMYEDVEFDSVQAIPADGYVVDDSTTALAIGDSWWSYNPATHTLSPVPNVYIVKTVDGHHAKLEFIAKDFPTQSEGVAIIKLHYTENVGTF